MIGGQNTCTSREMSVKKYLTDNNPLNLFIKNRYRSVLTISVLKVSSKLKDIEEKENMYLHFARVSCVNYKIVRMQITKQMGLSNLFLPIF